MSKGGYFTLLCELKSVLEKNNISYVLGGSEKDFEMLERITDYEKQSRVCIYVNGKNAAKLIAAQNQFPEDRILDTPLSNPKAVSTNMYYINTNSVAPNFRNFSRRLSNGVTIVIRVVSVYKEPQSGFLAGRTGKKKSITDNNSEALKEKFNKIIGERWYDSKSLFGKVRRSISGKEPLCTVQIHGKDMIFPMDYFKGKEKISINGEDFWCKTIQEGNNRSLSVKDYGLKDDPYYFLGWRDDAYEKLYNDDQFWEELDERRSILREFKRTTALSKDNWLVANEIYKCINRDRYLYENIDVIRRMYELEDYFGVIEFMIGYLKVIKHSQKYGYQISSELVELFISSREHLKKHQ